MVLALSIQILYLKYIMPTAPDESPQNATVDILDSSRVECRWLPPLPEDVNGIVTGFIVRVTGQDSYELIELQTNQTSILVENLHPFYSYVFTVAALTEAGRGPFTSVVYFQMLTAGTIILLFVKNNYHYCWCLLF